MGKFLDDTDAIDEGLLDYLDDRQVAIVNEEYNKEIRRDIAIADARIKLGEFGIFELVLISISEPADSVLFAAACEELESRYNPDRDEDWWDCPEYDDELSNF